MGQQLFSMSHGCDSACVAKVQTLNGRRGARRGRSAGEAIRSRTRVGDIGGAGRCRCAGGCPFAREGWGDAFAAQIQARPSRCAVGRSHFAGEQRHPGSGGVGTAERHSCCRGGHTFAHTVGGDGAAAAQVQALFCHWCAAAFACRGLCRPLRLAGAAAGLLVRVLRGAHQTVQRVCRAFRTAWCDGRTTLTVNTSAKPAGNTVDAAKLRGLLTRLPLLERLETLNVDTLPWAGCCPRLREVTVRNSSSSSLARLMDMYGTREEVLWAVDVVRSDLADCTLLMEDLQQGQPLPQEQQESQQMLATLAKACDVMRRLLTEYDQIAQLPEEQRLLRQQRLLRKLLLPQLQQQQQRGRPELRSCLTVVSLYSCSKLRDLGAIVLFPNLHTLVFHNCTALEHLEPLGKCAELASLRLIDCPELIRVDPLASCAHLNALQVDACDALMSIESLAACRHLASLSLQSCRNVMDGVVAVAAMTQLTALEFSKQRKFHQLMCGQPVASQQLAMLAVVSCPELRDIRSLVSPYLSTLGRLDLSGCVNLALVDGLSACVSLSSVNLRRCLELRDVGAALAGSQSSLTSLDLSFCAGVASFAMLSGCSGLTTLQLQGCTQLMAEEEGGVGTSSSSST